MKNFLKENLPKSFRSSKVIKGGYSAENHRIVNTVSLVKSDFLDGEDKWVFVLSIDIKDIYWDQDVDKVHCHVVEASVLDDEIVYLEQWNKISHWDLNDKEGLLQTLNETVLPWIDRFLQPDILVDYLKHLEAMDSGEDNSIAIAKYGSILSEKVYWPPRTRKLYNEAIASIYESMGKYELALTHLKKHREFVISDHKQTTLKRLNDAYKKSLKLIDNGIISLQEKIII